MEEGLKAGFFKIKSCLLSTYDASKRLEISNMVYKFTISEGIFQTAIQASLSLYDTLNIVDGFPLRGEELISLEIEDFYGESETYLFHVISIGPVTVNSSGVGQDYVINLMSPEYVRTEATEIRKSYTGAPHMIGEEIHREYFQSTKRFNYEFTAGSGTYVIPAMTPFEAMDFLARKAYSSSNVSSYFYFFETREDFKFTTLENLITDGANNYETYNYVDPKQSGSLPAEAMKNIISYRNNSRFNVLEEMRAGAQISRTFTVDLALKTVNKDVYKHYEKLEETRHTEANFRQYHSDAFNRDFYSDDNVISSWIVFNDTTKPESYYADILPRRVASEYYYKTISLSVTLYGSWKLNVGDLVEINIPDPEVGTTTENPHRSLSGKYIVENLYHRMDENGWRVEANLIRDTMNSLDEYNYVSASAG